MVAAAALAVVFHRLRQPALLAYIVAGLVLGRFSQAFSGSVHVMEQVSHLGLVFLLFIIGSGLCGFATDLPTLIFFRILQRVGASSEHTRRKGRFAARRLQRERSLHAPQI